MSTNNEPKRNPFNQIAEAVQKLLHKAVDRRTFVKGAAVGAAVAAAPQKTEALSFDAFFQKHYKELTEEEKKKVFERLQKEAKEDYGVDVTIDDPPPIPGVKFGYFFEFVEMQRKPSLCGGLSKRK